MMATTATSARPEIELRGTIGVSKRGTAHAPAMRGGAVISVSSLAFVRMIIEPIS